MDLGQNILVLGLGNIGKKYESNRHNAGFMCIESMLDSLGIRAKNEAYLDSNIAIIGAFDFIKTLNLDFFKNINLNEKFKKNIHEILSNKNTSQDSKIIFAMPTTFMNLSGKALAKILKRYEIEHIFILQDDIDTKIGNINFKEKGSSGGHNGIKSVLENECDFMRIKIGVGANIFLSYIDLINSDAFKFPDFKCLDSNINSMIKNLFLESLILKLSANRTFCNKSFFHILQDLYIESIKNNLTNDSEKLHLQEYIKSYKTLNKSLNLEVQHYVLQDFNKLEMLALKYIFDYIHNALILMIIAKALELNINLNVNLK